MTTRIVDGVARPLTPSEQADLAARGTLSEAELLALVEQGIAERQQAKFAYDFGETVAVSDAGVETPAGVKHIQMRDTPKNPDQDNWRSLVAAINAAALLVDLADGDLVAYFAGVEPIRVEENVNVQTPRAQLLQALLAAAARNGDILFDGIAIKAAIRAASTPAAKLAAWQASGWA